MRTLSCLLFLVQLASAGDGKKVSTDPEDITGLWLIEAANYRGSVQIVKLGDAHLVQWNTIAEKFDESGKLVAVGLSSFRGVGIRVGDTFAVSWKDGDKVGVTIYGVAPGRLSGRSVMEGAVLHTKEVLKRK